MKSLPFFQKPTMRSAFKAGILFMAGAALIAGCASAPQHSRQQALQQNDSLAQLDAGISSITKEGAQRLAPESYTKTHGLFQQALDAAQSGDKADTDRYTREGLKALKQLERNTQKSQELLTDVLTNRDKAMQAGAAKFFKDTFQKLDEELRDAGNLIEQGRINSAKQVRPKLIKQYGKLELDSIKKGAVFHAKAAIAEARQVQADDYAPQTLKLAEEELTLALSILEANRTASKKANEHTSRAIELAKQSIQIMEVIKDFERTDASEEDKVLWYQKQLSIINQPLQTRLAFDKDNRTTVLGIRSDIASLADAKSELNKTLVSTEKKLNKLINANKSELSKLKRKYEREVKQQKQQREALVKRDRETRQRFEYIQSLFTEKEAEIYRKRQNVLVLAHGFYFEPGKSEIKSVNFSLLNKIDKAFKKFPGSRLVISGHTDSTGNAKNNKSLSHKRAANVARFLRETKGIPKSKIRVRGYGEEKPVASNSTKEGRSRNRRIEVLIENKLKNT